MPPRRKGTRRARGKPRADRTAAPPKEPRPAGRPKIEIDPVQVEKLAAIDCTMREIASVVGCSVDTLERRFAEVIEKGREQGKASIKRALFHMAVNRHNIAAAIWLSKQRLGYSDHPPPPPDQQRPLEVLTAYTSTDGEVVPVVIGGGATLEEIRAAVPWMDRPEDDPDVPSSDR